MKILVGIDGSKDSQKALREAVKIGKGCKAEEVAVILVSDPKDDFAFFPYEYVPSDFASDYQKILEKQEKEANKLLLRAKEFIESNHLKARTIFKEGHPSNTIVQTAEEEKYDLVVLGNRGFGGLKKMLLGSVSNAVVQEIKDCNVLIVK